MSTSNLDEMAEKYSKKWNVPIEEAKKKVKEFLEKRPIDRAKVVPSSENIFPEPIGPLSEKVQDINQSLLSTAFTKKTLAEVNQPPEEIKSLREEVESIKKQQDSFVGFVNTTVKEWKEELDSKNTQEEREKLLKDIDEKTVKPLEEKMGELEKTLKKLSGEEEGKPGASKPSLNDLEEAIKNIKSTTESAKGFLQTLGFPIEKLEEKPSVVVTSKTQPTQEISPEDHKKALEGMGYKVTGGPISYEQLDKMLKEASDKAREEILDDKRIDAVADIIKDSIKEIIEMFKPAVNIYTEYMFKDKGGQSSPASKEQSVSQEKQA